MPTAVQPADGYAYLLPNGWVHLDADPGRRAASVRRAVRRRVRREPLLAPHLAQLDRLLLAEVALAAAHGAERVSLLAEPVDGHAVTASVTLVVESPAAIPAGAAEVPLDAQGVFERLVADHVRALTDDPTAGLEIVALHQQDAVRRTWVDGQGSSPNWPSKHWQMLMAWPGRASVAVLTMASPCAPLWPRFEETFDACARTFRWTWSSGGDAVGSD